MLWHLLARQNRRLHRGCIAATPTLMRKTVLVPALAWVPVLEQGLEQGLGQGLGQVLGLVTTAREAVARRG